MASEMAQVGFEIPFSDEKLGCNPKAIRLAATGFPKGSDEVAIASTQGSGCLRGRRSVREPLTVDGGQHFPVPLRRAPGQQARHVSQRQTFAPGQCHEMLVFNGVGPGYVTSTRFLFAPPDKVS